MSSRWKLRPFPQSLASVMSTVLLWCHSVKPGSRSRGRGKSCPISGAGYQAHCWEGTGKGIDIPVFENYNL